MTPSATSGRHLKTAKNAAFNDFGSSISGAALLPAPPIGGLLVKSNEGAEISIGTMFDPISPRYPKRGVELGGHNLTLEFRPKGGRQSKTLY